MSQTWFKAFQFRHCYLGFNIELQLLLRDGERGACKFAVNVLGAGLDLAYSRLKCDAINKGNVKCLWAWKFQ